MEGLTIEFNLAYNFYMKTLSAISIIILLGLILGSLIFLKTHLTQRIQLDNITNDTCQFPYIDTENKMKLCFPIEFVQIKNAGENGSSENLVINKEDASDHELGMCFARKEDEGVIQYSYGDVKIICYKLADDSSPKLDIKKFHDNDYPYNLIKSANTGRYEYTVYSHSLYFAEIEVRNIKLTDKNINFYYYSSHAKASNPWTNEQIDSVVNSIEEL